MLSGKEKNRNWFVKTIISIAVVLLYCFHLQARSLTKEERLLRTKNRTNYAEEETLSISDISVNSSQIQKYDKFEITFKLAGTYEDPFDPDQIAVDGHFISPSGVKTVMPGFFYQDYIFQEKINGKSTLLHGTDFQTRKHYIPRPMPLKGKPCWKIRFAPTEGGLYKFHIEAKDKNGKVETRTETFRAVEGKNKGYIRASKTDPYYFELTTGEFIYPIGQNLSRNSDDWTYYFPLLAKNSVNLIKVAPDYLTNPVGYGKYNLFHFWLLDKKFEAANEMGIYIQIWMDWHGSFGKAWSPYTIDVGGPCNKIEDFFTTENAKNYYKKVLRYFVARYGYANNLFSWMLISELGAIKFYAQQPEKIKKWYIEMAGYLRSIDPYKHLITAAYANGGAYRGERLWLSSEIDYVQEHVYQVEPVKQLYFAYQGLKKYKKPMIIGEYGNSPVYSPITPDCYDTKGVAIHVGLWTSYMLPYAGTPLSWWWDRKIDAYNLYYHYKALANFAKNEDRRNKNFIISSAQTDSDKLNVLGIQNNREAFLWIYNLAATIFNTNEAKEGKPFAPFPQVEESVLTVSNLFEGIYDIELWDTYKGEIKTKQKLRVNKDNKLTIKLPELSEDIACKIKLAEPAGTAEQKMSLVDFSPFKDCKNLRGGKKETIKCKRLSSVTVDGKLDDWKIEEDGVKLSIQKGCAVNYRQDNDTRIRDDKDLSAVLHSGYDDKNLYVAVRVFDDVVMGREKVERLYDDDAVEFWLDAKHDSADINMPHNPGCYQIVFAPFIEGKFKPSVWVYRNQNINPVIKVVKVAGSLEKDGYIIEACIPVKVIHGLKLESGKILGFNLSVMDRDSKSDSRKQLILYGYTPQDASQWSDLILE